MRAKSLVLISAFTTLFLAVSACVGGDAPTTVPTPPGAVTPASVALVTVSPATADLPVGEKITIAVTLQNNAGKPITGTHIDWTTSDASIAAVSPLGEVTAVRAGVATITATSDKKAGKAIVTVTSDTPSPIAVASVSVSPTSTSLQVGRSAQLTATARDAFGNALSGPTITWTSSNSAAAPVSAAGLVSGAEAGTSTLTATSKGVSGRATITVTPMSVQAPPPVATVTITPTTASVIAGLALQFVATPKDAGGNPLSGRIMMWTSSNAAVATVTATGLLAGIASGTVTVVATSEGHSASATVTVSAAFGGVAVYPGQSIQAAVNGNPAGTAFLLKTGTHRQQSVVPKAGDVFQGEPGTVLDGENATTYAFRGWNGSWVNNVTIRGLKITRYRPPVQDGAIAAGNDTNDASSGWRVENCEISYNLVGGGIRIGNGMQVLGNNVHHNAQIGISGIGDDVLVEGNEIASNNPLDQYDPGWEAGGTKFVKTRRLVVRANYVHDNHGPGLWTDIDNVQTVYENNRVEDNTSEGIVHEISYAAVIRNNTVQRNGLTNPHNWLWGAGIGIHGSPNVEVYGNTLTNNNNGIVAIQQARGDGAYGPRIVQNLFVHDNVVVQDNPAPGLARAAAGMAQDVGDNAVFTSRNNRFANNTYYLGANANPFEWMGGWRTEQVWRAYGNDVSGTFNR